MPKILLIEDDEVMAAAIHDSLCVQNHEVEMLTSGEDGLDRLRFYEYDLIICDWGLPGEVSGIDICKAFRTRGGTTPVLMLTGKSSVDEKEHGLDAGADDYLTKPFHIKELNARVRALLRRSGSGAGSDKLRFGNLEFDERAFRCMKDDQELAFTAKELQVLHFLMRNPDRMFTPEALIERVWPASSDVNPELIRTYVKKLRSKIDDEGKPSRITNVPGLGYRFDSTK
jgi:DNA-binding response OmpR family regulator